MLRLDLEGFGAVLGFAIVMEKRDDPSWGDVANEFRKLGNQFRKLGEGTANEFRKLMRELLVGLGPELTAVLMVVLFITFGGLLFSLFLGGADEPSPPSTVVERPVTNRRARRASNDACAERVVQDCASWEGTSHHTTCLEGGLYKCATDTYR